MYTHPVSPYAYNLSKKRCERSTSDQYSNGCKLQQLFTMEHSLAGSSTVSHSTYAHLRITLHKKSDFSRKWIKWCFESSNAVQHSTSRHPALHPQNSSIGTQKSATLTHGAQVRRFATNSAKTRVICYAHVAVHCTAGAAITFCTTSKCPKQQDYRYKYNIPNLTSTNAQEKCPRDQSHCRLFNCL